MSIHFREVCEYGHVHDQCRCFSNDKYTKNIKCNMPIKHATENEVYQPKHRMEFTD